MIKLEHTKVVGWEAAIRGMRNPMNSWDKSDSVFVDYGGDWTTIHGYDSEKNEEIFSKVDEFRGIGQPIFIGANDMGLMKRLCKAGTDHRKFMRMLTVYVDITAPLYWWKEFDTYKVGTVANSCSTMHRIHAKEFTLEDFSCEHLNKRTSRKLLDIINELNFWRNAYCCESLEDRGSHFADDINWNGTYIPTKKECWWQMIQLLPSSYNQKRTVMLNYEVLANIYKSRKNHKLDEWSISFMEWINTLPYAEELIIGEE